MLVSLQKVKEYLQETGTAFDTLLQDIIEGVSVWTETYCDRTFKQATYTEQYDGDATPTLLVRNTPIDSVTTIHDDTLRVFGAADLIAATDYVIYGTEGRIVLDGLFFAKGLQNIKIVYVAGFKDADLPRDLQQAIKELVADRFRNKESQGIKSTRIGAFAVTYDASALPKEVKSVFDSYRRTRVAG